MLPSEFGESYATEADVEALHKEIELAKAQSKVNEKHQKINEAREAKQQLIKDEAKRIKESIQVDGLIHLKDGTREFPDGTVVTGVNGNLIQTSDDVGFATLTKKSI